MGICEASIDVRRATALAGVLTSAVTAFSSSLLLVSRKLVAS